MVALRKESVDRNISGVNRAIDIVESLSVRRAWIEIYVLSRITTFEVSLSVRRAWIEINQTWWVDIHTSGSLSVRRAWIEINVIVHSAHPHKVALRKESVDRNVLQRLQRCCIMSLSVRRAWIEIHLISGLRVLAASRSP